MSGGSYIRLVLGILLSLTVLLSFASGESVSAVSAALAVIFLIMTVVWVAFRF